MKAANPIDNIHRTANIPLLSSLPQEIRKALNIKRTEYVVGFCFNGAGHVVLIRKNRPEWQNGLLNGVGGHIESGESPEGAMKREFKEETGIETSAHDWTLFAKLVFPEAIVHFFKMKKVFSVTHQIKPPPDTDEPIFNCEWRRTITTVGETVPNLKWLIPLALADESPVTIYY